MKKPNPIPNSNGGRRAGAGRKPLPKTLLARLALAELEEEAEKSIMFLVHLRDNPAASWGVRAEAAKNIIEMRFGKPKQMMTLSGGEAPLTICYVPAKKRSSSGH